MFEEIREHYRIVFVNVVLNSIAFALAGVLQTLNAIMGYSIAFVGNNLLEGLVLVLVAFVFMHGVKCFVKGQGVDGYALAVAGALLVTILFLLHIIILATNALGFALGLEDWAEWQLAQDLNASIWLFPFALPIIRFYRMQRPKKTN